MSVIYLTTKIKAPIHRCFDLSRSIDLHLLSTTQTSETAVAGVTRGLIGHNEQVTWRAKHFGIYQHMTTIIPEYDAPYYFKSKMLKGAFKRIDHQHIFEEAGAFTVMKDVFDFDAPLGILGKISSKLFLYNYMKRLLEERNKVIKKVAESDEWKKVLAI